MPLCFFTPAVIAFLQSDGHRASYTEFRARRMPNGETCVIMSVRIENRR